MVFNHTPLSEVAKNHAEKGKKDILEGLKIVTSGPSVKERTTTPKEKEDKYKLVFGFKESGKTSFEIVAEDYALSERKSRLGALFTPLFFEGKGFQAVAIIIIALAHAKDLNKHSDAVWLALIENRNTEGCYYNTLDYMDRVSTTLFCNAIREYALRLDKELEAELNDFSPSGFWARTLPKNKNEALFIAQLLCDGGINKYGLSCAGLTENLLKDIYDNIGLASVGEVDEYLANLDKEGEVE